MDVSMTWSRQSLCALWVHLRWSLSHSFHSSFDSSPHQCFPPPDRRDRTTNHICTLLSWTSSYGYITESKFLTRFDQVALELLFFYLNTVNVRWLSNDVQKYAAEKSHAATNNVVFFKAHIHYTFQHIKTIIDRSVHKN